MARDREAYIQNLRALADFLESHPGVVTPGGDPTATTINAFAVDKAEIASVARASTWEKHYGTGPSAGYFWLKKQFGFIAYEVNCHREDVCRKVVKGTKVIPAKPEEVVEDVEWVCDDALLSPLLSHSGPLAE